MMNFLNLELTSRCNKSCWMCGRRKIERELPDLAVWGDMPYEMLEEIEKQVPKGTVVQFHNNGESLEYPALGKALKKFVGRIRCFNTNAKELGRRAGDIIANLETLTISVIQDDPEGDEQFETVKRFLERKGDRSPQIVYRLLGRVHNRERWERLPGLVATRILHAPGGSYNYTQQVTIPETGICQDLLTRLAIDRYGNISLCVRFDPQGDLRLGNVKDMTLGQAWNSEKRHFYIKQHIEQRRTELPGCDRCHYFGVPCGE